MDSSPKTKRPPLPPPLTKKKKNRNNNSEKNESQRKMDEEETGENRSMISTKIPPQDVLEPSRFIQESGALDK